MTHNRELSPRACVRIHARAAKYDEIDEIENRHKRTESANLFRWPEAARFKDGKRKGYPSQCKEYPLQCKGYPSQCDYYYGFDHSVYRDFGG